MNLVSGTILALLLLVVCCASRRWALLAVLAGVFVLTRGHAVDLGPLTLHPIRFLEAAAFARVLLRRELAWSHLNKLDWLLLLLYNYAALVWILRSANVAAEQFAYAVDPTLWYLGLRGMIWRLEDLRWLLAAFAWLLVPYAALVLLERLTHHSAFAIVGATPDLVIRNGKARCSGAFGSPILLGSIAASFIPLYVGLWFAGWRRLVAALGGSLSLLLVVLSNSGGPLTSAISAFIGCSLWRMRGRMRYLRRSILVLLIFLSIAMKDSLWYLPFKVSAITGGGGYHRSLLMDRAWNDLHKWWLFGTDISETAGWFPYKIAGVWGASNTDGGADITNQFLVFGVKAGLACMIIFITVLVFGFRYVGRARALMRDRRDAVFVWGLGVTLFVHVVSWLGVSYFDQSYVVWLLHLAAISTLAQRACVTSALGQSAPALLKGSAA